MQQDDMGMHDDSPSEMVLCVGVPSGHSFVDPNGNKAVAGPSRMVSSTVVVRSVHQ